MSDSCSQPARRIPHLHTFISCLPCANALILTVLNPIRPGQYLSIYRGAFRTRYVWPPGFQCRLLGSSKIRVVT
ncbi:hypothetical protein BJ166DRAFT_514901 [Pestalotiopsis sp. NC0098]|nr:hypothetical protein BJ166DRAFT_514901 [Pestalotiopsis sp. NC0098]